jgi:starch synthase (maltosyl-transferring)
LTHLNRLRRTHPSLKHLRNLRFHHVDNDRVLAFSRRDEETGDTVLVVVTLDPFSTAEATTSLDMPSLGLDWHDRFLAHDEMGGGMHDYEWGQHNYVRLDPYVEPAHILVVRR